MKLMTSKLRPTPDYIAPQHAGYSHPHWRRAMVLPLDGRPAVKRTACPGMTGKGTYPAADDGTPQIALARDSVLISR